MIDKLSPLERMSTLLERPLWTIVGEASFQRSALAADKPATHLLWPHFPRVGLVDLYLYDSASARKRLRSQVICDRLPFHIKSGSFA